jgi:hypothetical protein
VGGRLTLSQRQGVQRPGLSPLVDQLSTETIDELTEGGCRLRVEPNPVVAQSSCLVLEPWRKNPRAIGDIFGAEVGGCNSIPSVHGLHDTDGRADLYLRSLFHQNFDQLAFGRGGNLDVHLVYLDDYQTFVHLDVITGGVEPLHYDSSVSSETRKLHCRFQLLSLSIAMWLEVGISTQEYT